MRQNISGLVIQALHYCLSVMMLLPEQAEQERTLYYLDKKLQDCCYHKQASSRYSIASSQIVEILNFSIPPIRHSHEIVQIQDQRHKVLVLCLAIYFLLNPFAEPIPHQKEDHLHAYNVVQLRFDC